MRYSSVPVLLRASLSAHRGRFVAAAIAISVAAGVLLATLVGQRAVRTEAPREAQALLGDAELHLAAMDTVHPFVDESLLAEMRVDPRVARLTTAVSVRAVDQPGTESGALDREAFYSRQGGGLGGWIPGRRDNYLAWDDGGPRGTLVAGRWPSASTDPIEVVAQKQYSFGQKIGAWRLLESDRGVHRAIVVGLVDSGEAFAFTPQGARMTTRLISRPAAERLAGGPRPPSDARLVLHRAEDRAAFIADWQGRVASLPGRLELWDEQRVRQAVLDSVAAQSVQTAVLSAVLLAAACVVCITLAVQGSAVRERAAQYTLLRSLGASRGILAAVVLAEAATLAAVGLLGAVAIVWALLAGLGSLVPFLKLGAAPDLLSVSVTGAVILASVLAGSAWPAYTAARSRPSEVAAYYDDPVRAARGARRGAAVAAAVAALVTAIVLSTPDGSLTRAGVVAWVGVPGLALVSVLLTPAVVRAVGHLFARPVAWLTRTDPLILADQTAGDGPRSAGSVVAVAVGLGAFLWTLCWGASMLDSFVIDPRVPRWLVSVHPYGLDRVETECVLADPALRGFQPLTLVDTRLGDLGGAGDRAVPTLVMGVDLRRALGDGPDALPFQFVAGDREEAAAALAKGDACLVSDWFATSAGVSIGDRLPVAVPGATGADGSGDRTYRVAGVVELRGWRMATKLNKVRLRGDKHRAMVVLDAGAARRDFPVAHANYLLGDPPAGADGRVPGFRADLPLEAAYAASNAEREQVAEKVAAMLDLDRPVEYRADGAFPTRLNKRTVQVDDLDRTRHSLLGEWGGGAVKKMGWVPLVVLGLSLLSVTGALVAALRSHARELGILRSCGLSRAGLSRLALAESLLLGLAAVPVAALFGGGAAWLTLQVSSIVGYRLDFAGIRPEFTVPWEWLWPGWAMTVAVCGLAALWAGWRVGRVPPSSLMAGSANLP